MAARGGIRLIKDQNLNRSFTDSGSFGGNGNGSKLQKKGGVTGRKPLGDLSNARNQAIKNQSSKGFTVIEENVSNSSKIKSNVVSKRSTSKAAGKAQSTSRKALTDISNSKKTQGPETLKKSTGTKLGVLAEDSILADAIAEEGFLHNHEDCIKMQDCAMDKNCFLETLGLDKGPSKQFVSPWISPVSSKLRPESPAKYYYLEHEEMAEVPIAKHSPPRLEVSSGLDSPNPCQTPSPDRYSHWKDQESGNFTLMDSPQSFKHGFPLHQCSSL